MSKKCPTPERAQIKMSKKCLVTFQDVKKMSWTDVKMSKKCLMGKSSHAKMSKKCPWPCQAVKKMSQALSKMSKNVSGRLQDVKIPSIISEPSSTSWAARVHNMFDMSLLSHRPGVLAHANWDETTWMLLSGVLISTFSFKLFQRL